ncbi:MAG: p21-activated protein kinase-interacting protein 1-like protein [Lichina confinis]|nr:MAG: p21-activated protein kinase-interacting protein 1-like protein [Lichina confinis]
MGKRKRSAKSDEEVRASVPSVSPSPGDADGSRDGGAHGSTVTAVDRSCQEYSGPLRTIQVVVGSYERVLHGVTATLPSPRSNSNEGKPACRFADTFLFNAHSSAIRCLAVSPVSQAEGAKPGSKVILASGGTDERINLYHLSTSPPADDGSRPILPTLTEKPAMENPKNRELGSLLHHSAAITALEFPTRSKLLSSAEDNTVAITRTRDWTALSTIKAPLTRAQGRPSGDTAPPGAVPSGINDFAVHPSRKVMLSVSKGERCMRLWNLVTGRKAGVLRFDKTIMQAIGGSKQSLSEARKMAWNSTGDQFVVCYDRGAVVYQANCKPKCLVLASPPSKLCQVRYVILPGSPAGAASGHEPSTTILAASTEDGRVIFFSSGEEGHAVDGETPSDAAIPNARILGELGGSGVGVSGRVKDFVLLPLMVDPSETEVEDTLLVVTGSSDGSIRIWHVKACELIEAERSVADGSTDAAPDPSSAKSKAAGQQKPHAAQKGQLLGASETGLRITCLVAYVMTEPVSTVVG